MSAARNILYSGRSGESLLSWEGANTCRGKPIRPWKKKYFGEDSLHRPQFLPPSADRPERTPSFVSRDVSSPQRFPETSPWVTHGKKCGGCSISLRAGSPDF